jgi:transcriptional regulator with XRE-family HTH domain
MPSGKGSLDSLGDFIQSQRRLANLSIRQLSRMTKVSNPYLSQIERGVYRPSAKVLKAIAGALNISAEQVYARAGLLDEADRDPAASPAGVEEAIRLDERLSTVQKDALIRVYRGFIGGEVTGGRSSRRRDTSRR